MAGFLTSDKIKNVFKHLIFWKASDSKIYKTSDDGQSDVEIVVIANDINLTGTVTGVTQTANDNSTKLATTAYVDNIATTTDASYADDEYLYLGTGNDFSLSYRTSTDTFEMKSESNVIFSANNDVVVLPEKGSAPSVANGGMYFDGTDLYIGTD